MDIIFKGFGGVFILLLLTFTGVGIIHSTMEANAADQYYSETIKQISESNFSDAVISECKKHATERGYGLCVDTYYVNGSKRKHGVVSMTYPFSLPILGIEKEYDLKSDVW